MPVLNNLRILIADDHEIVREGLRAIISSKPGWIVCAEATNGRDAVARAEEHQPDIVVMDITMPLMNGLEATRKIRKILPKAGIVVFSFHFTEQLVRDVVDAGAQAYVLKSDSHRDLLSAVEAVANRRSFFTRSATKVIIDGASEKGSSTPSRKGLTPREREVVQLLAEGKSSKEVASRLGISFKTAETHRTNLMRKLDVHSISELVRYAVKNKIIEP